jgi:penicillin-binding protein 2
MLEPEEILFDANVKNSYKGSPERLEFSIPTKLIYLFLFIGILSLGILWVYSGYLSIFKNEKYKALAERNKLRTTFIQAPRGKIYDRFGEILADNKEIFDVGVLPFLLPKDEEALYKISDEVSSILGIPREEVFQKIKKAQRSKYSEYITLWRDIDSDKAIKIKNLENSLTGVKLLGRYIRVYPKGPAFSHIIGYTGSVSGEEFLGDDSNILPGDIVGKDGVERSYDKILRGKKGVEEIEINSLFEVVDIRKTAFPEPGKDIKLTIDAQFQQKLYDIITEYLLNYGYERAAAVALNPQNGEIIALLSIPSFDNNLFGNIVDKKNYEKLIKDPRKPLFNRAISGLYSPGSTVKPFIASAALQEGIINQNTIIDASRGYISIPNPYHPNKISIFHDWRPHGLIDVRKAIAWSSNVFFYVIGGGYQNIKGLGITKISEYLRKFGFGRPTGIGLPGESIGIVPDPKWKSENNPQDPIWRIGDTYITSIGQGYLLVTPIQLAFSYSILVNDGNIIKPKLVLDPQESSFTTSTIGISPENIKIVKDGMRLTTAEGSARSLSDLPFESAGKTGTVEVPKGKTNAVFVVYAPYENPQILLVIIVENGGEGSSTAVPIAKEALLWYWENRLKML